MKVIVLILVILPLPLFYATYYPAHLNVPVQPVAWVTWGDNPATEVIIGWETPDPAAGVLKFGTAAGALDNETAESAGVQIHSVPLAGLTPDTDYHYSIELQGTPYASGQFRTAPDNAETPFSFALISDVQPKLGPGWHRRTATILKERAKTVNYSFVSVIGDFVEEGVKTEWNYFFKIAGAYLDSLPIVPVIGNHDKPRDLDGNESNGDETYYYGQYFPHTADRLADTNDYDQHEQYYFSFNWSSVHFQVLHFPEVDVDDGGEENGINPGDYHRAFTEDQMEWIRADLQNAQSLPFRISMFHCPITSAGFFGPNSVMIEELLPILREYNVSAVINGHSHHFERGEFPATETFTATLPYFLVASGGGLTDIGIRPVPETIKCIVGPCFTEVQVTASAIKFTTFSFEGKILDEFQIPSEGGQA